MAKNKKPGRPGPDPRPILIRDLTAFARHYKEHLSIRVAGQKMGLSYNMAHKHYTLAVAKHLMVAREHIAPTTTEQRKAAMAPPVIGGRVEERVTSREAVPPTGKVRRFILTCAQNNTTMNEELWTNMKALSKHYKARILVARTVYNRFAEASSMDKKLVIKGQTGVNEYVWDDRLTKYFADERMELAPGLVWCGETNVIPTAANPLTGFETYTGRNSSILPHPRIAMRSIPTHPSEGTKLMYTTGTLTTRNYIQRKAGQLAEFHHCYGGLLVEVDEHGNWFCRQLNAHDDGVLHDWDVRVENGQVSTGNRIEAINWGDLHPTYEDPIATELAFGKGGMLDQLAPRHQFMHDLLDNRVVNPHRAGGQKHIQSFIEHQLGHTSVEKEMEDTAGYLFRAQRRLITKTIVVKSNHDNWLNRWIELCDFRSDRKNAVYFLRAALHMWENIAKVKTEANMTKWAILNSKWGPDLGEVVFLDEDEPFQLLGIEFGMHGHQGANGTRGTAMGLSKFGRRANIGDKHTCGIYDGLYVSGVLGSLDQGYNKGPGSWSQSQIITYPNGKRAMVTFYKGKMRA